MKTYTPDELKQILALHAKWLRGESDGVRANLRYANLGSANLGSADLRSANLRYADLGYADLRYANLGYANLGSANLGYALWNDTTQWPAITAVLLAEWGEVSDELCRDLMRYDAVCHPDNRAFNSWAEGGPCPYNNVRIGRAAHFVEKKALWVPGPVKPYDLFQRLLAEKLVKTK